MPSDQKTNKYHRRSRSSSSDRAHRDRNRRDYGKDKPERYDKYHRRSRSRTPPRADSQKNKYTMSYQYRPEKRLEDSYQNADKSKYYQGPPSKVYDSGPGKYYDGNFNRREPYEKKDRDKNEDYYNKSKYNRYEQSDNYKGKDRQLTYERRDRGKRSPSRDRKPRRSPSSRSISKSPKQPIHVQSKPIVNKKSPLQKINEQDCPEKPPRKPEPQRQRQRPLFPPPPPPPPKKVERERDMVAIQKTVVKEFTNIQTIKRLPTSELKQLKYEQPLTKTKVNKFQLIMNQARQNLVVTPPTSSFLILQTFRTMNKFQVETLDPKWTYFLKKDMQKYSQIREATLSSLSQPFQTIKQDGSYNFGQQYIWIKQQRNENEIDLRFRLEQFKQHNANLSELMRKMKAFE